MAAASIYNFNKTDASNTSFAGITQAENSMKPSDVNDDFRAHDGAFARWLMDIGATGTVGGTGNAITLALNETSLTAYGSSANQIPNGAIIAFKAGAANSGATTINVNTIGTKAIRAQGDTALVGGEIVSGGVYLLRYDTAYNSAAGAWVLLNPSTTATVLTSTAFSPATNDAVALGTTSLQWSDLFLASGGVINWAAGNVTLTQSSGVLTTTGSLVMSKANPLLIIDKAASGQGNDIYGRTAGSTRWQLVLGNTTAETGSSAGSNFILNAYDDSASFIDTPISIARVAGGQMTLSRNSVFSGFVLSTSPTAGVGYAAGAGGIVTQSTNKSTGVTLSKVSGQITMNNAALGASTTVSFTLTNTAIAAGDVLILNHVSGGTAGAYALNAQCGAGSASINVRNITGGSLSEAIVIGFVVVKGVTS